MYEQELRCTPYNHNSLADTKAITDKAYRLISSHAYRMHWIESDEEKSIEQSATAYLNCVSAKLEDLIAQVRANRNAMTPSYELDSRAKYLKDMFDREMRFPLRDRWDSVDKAKTHTDNAYKKCLNHAKRMNWIKGE